MDFTKCVCAFGKRSLGNTRLIRFMKHGTNWREVWNDFRWSLIAELCVVCSRCLFYYFVSGCTDLSSDTDAIRLRSMPFCYSTFTSTRVMNHEQPDPTGAEQTSLRFHLHVRRSLVFISASRRRVAGAAHHPVQRFTSLCQWWTPWNVGSVNLKLSVTIVRHEWVPTNI